MVGEVDPAQEPDALLLLRQVEEELHHADPVVGEVALPVVDLAVAALPDPVVARFLRQLLPLEQLLVDADDEHLFVVGAVEDPDLAAGRKVLRVAPEVVVVELLGRGHLEAVHGDALRVDAAHHVTDRPVLAGGVERLEDDQHAVGPLGVEARLVLGEHADALREQLAALLLRFEALLVPGVEVLGERDLRVRLDLELLDELGDALLAYRCHLLPPSDGSQTLTQDRAIW